MLTPTAGLGYILRESKLNKEKKMSKAHRGTGIRDQFNNGRATCPVCKRTAIKCLYEKEIDGNKVKICKECNAKLSK